MNWTTIFAGIAAFVSIVNVFVTIRNNKAQIQAQIISSSRVQWIKEVREIYSNFIKLSTEFHNELLFLRVCDNEENFDKNFNMLRGNLWSSYYQLISYFPKNDSDGRNCEIVSIFNELVNFLEEKLEYSYRDITFSKFVPSFQELQRYDVPEQYKAMLNMVSDEFSCYMKAEWVKAKLEVENQFKFSK